MKHRSFRERFFIATQRAPFTWAYRKYYALAESAAVHRLSGDDRVRSIYVGSGMLEQPVFGLSDIDFLVIIDDDPGAFAWVHAALADLRLLFPVLDSVRRQTILGRGQLEVSLARRPFWEHRWGPHRRLRLVHGEDVLRTIPVRATPAEMALAEIGFLWGVALPRWEEEATPSHNYVAWKILAGTAQALHFAATGRFLPRREALLQSAARLDPNLTSLARDPFQTRGRLPLGALLRAIHDLVSPEQSHLAPEDESGSMLFSGAGWRPSPAARQATEALARGLPNASISLRLPHWYTTDAVTDPFPAAGEVRVRWPTLPSDGELSIARTAAREHPGVLVTAELGSLLFGLSGQGEIFATAAAAPDRFAAELELPNALHEAEIRIPVPAARERRLRDALRDWRSEAALVLQTRHVFQLTPEAQEGLVIRGAAAHVHETTPQRPIAIAPTPLVELGRHYGITVPQAAGPLRISVVVCTRNRAKLLRHTLEALTKQTRRADEVVVVDNGSTDETRNVIESFEKDLPLHYVFEPRPGIAIARNAGLRAARGDIFSFTDDDAIPAPDWCAAIERAFARDPHVGLVGGEVRARPGQAGAIASFTRRYFHREANASTEAPA